MKIEHHGICECTEDVEDFSGFHRKPLKKYTALDAHYLASKYGTDCFWCQYGDCWHVGSSKRWH